MTIIDRAEAWIVVEVATPATVEVEMEVEEDRRSWELELLEGRDSRPRYLGAELQRVQFGLHKVGS